MWAYITYAKCGISICHLLLNNIMYRVLRKKSFKIVVMYSRYRNIHYYSALIVNDMLSVTGLLYLTVVLAWILQWFSLCLNELDVEIV